MVKLNLFACCHLGTAFSMFSGLDAELPVLTKANALARSPHPHHPPREGLCLRSIDFFRTSQGIALVCVVVYFVAGGVYLSLEQHFTLLNAIYFSLGIVTTVGFEDETMSTKDSVDGQIFTAFFAIAAVLLVWISILLLIKWFLQRRTAWFNEVVKHSLDHIVDKKLQRQLTRHFSKKLHNYSTIEHAWKYFKASPVSQNALLTISLLVVGVGVVSKTENTTVINAFHWVISTATTIGFDNGTMTSQSGRIFVLFWLIPMVASMASLMAAVGQYVLHTRHREIEDFFHRDFSKELLKRFDRNEDKLISREEWLAATLLTIGSVEEREIELIMSHFDALDTAKSGELHLDSMGEIITGP